MLTATGGERCRVSVHWWDLDMEVRCRLPEVHLGLHTDGLRWWDQYGLQRPSCLNEHPLIAAGGLAGRGRTCGICTEPGHNRRTCTTAVA